MSRGRGGCGLLSTARGLVQSLSLRAAAAPTASSKGRPSLLPRSCYDVRLARKSREGRSGGAWALGNPGEGFKELRGGSQIAFAKMSAGWGGGLRFGEKQNECEELSRQILENERLPGCIPMGPRKKLARIDWIGRYVVDTESRQGKAGRQQRSAR